MSYKKFISGNRKLTLLIISLSVGACSFYGLNHTSGFINFDGLIFKNENYSIGENEKIRDSFVVDSMDKCVSHRLNKDSISLLYKDKKLVSLFVGYDNKSVTTSHGIKNGMTGKDVNKKYKDFKIIKEHSEGAGDSQDDFTYAIHDKEDRFKNEIVFDVVNGEVMGIHVSQKGLDGYICDQ